MNTSLSNDLHNIMLCVYVNSQYAYTRSMPIGLTKYLNVKYSDRGSSFIYFAALASASSNAIQKGIREHTTKMLLRCGVAKIY